MRQKRGQGEVKARGNSEEIEPGVYRLRCSGSQEQVGSPKLERLSGKTEAQRPVPMPILGVSKSMPDGGQC